MKRIGILGGTFNPVHIGHLSIAEMACELLKLNHVIFVPSYLPPHKSGKNIVSAKHRYRMVKMAIADNPHFHISDYEIKKPGKSYSIETVGYLRGLFPKKTRFFFIIGSDLVPALHTWKNIKDLFKAVTFVAVHRPGFKMCKPGANVKLITIPGLQTSSSYVRQRITAGKTVKYLVPDKIIRYIKQKRLYKR